MQYRILGSTGLKVSALAFGAGPVSDLMTGEDRNTQTAVVSAAIHAGINWFDTAATYGQGRSEISLGLAFKSLGIDPSKIHVATKVRLIPDQLFAIRQHVRESFAASLERLGLRRVTLLQLHNSVTSRRGDEATSITPEDVLGPSGVLEAFEELRAEGVIQHIGLTGIGQPAALRQVINSGRFQTMQVPYHVLNPSAGRAMNGSFGDTDYGNIISDCASHGMSVLAIRVLAGGALADNPPSAHTLKTPFFPLALYERDRLRAAFLAEKLRGRITLKDAAVRFALSHPNIQAAIIGFGDPAHVEEALQCVDAGPLPRDVMDLLHAAGDDRSDSPPLQSGGPT